MMITTQINVRTATIEDIIYAKEIVGQMADSAKARGTGTAKRCPHKIAKKMQDGEAVIAINQNGEWAGFCYIQDWDNSTLVSCSGLIVSPKYRGGGVATKLKKLAFALARKKYPHAKIFGITTSLAVMKINTALNFTPVTFSEIVKDTRFWTDCQSCANYSILQAKQHKHCLCTAMLFNPEAIKTIAKKSIAENYIATNLQYN